MSITGIRAARAYVELVMNDNKFTRGLALAEAEMRAFANKVTAIGTQMFGMGAAMLTPIAYSVRQFKEFDDTMRLVRAVTRATMNDFQKLSDKARLLGKTTSFTSQQVADAMANLGRAGFDTKQIDGMIKHVMNLARATQTGIANSAEIVGNAMRQFGLQTKDTEKVVDVLTTTANNSSQTLDDIAQAMKYAAPIAKEFGLTIQDTAYYIGILANQGLKGEMAGTSLRNMLIRLSGADTQAKFTADLQVKIRDAEGRVKNIKQLLDEAGAAMNERGWDQLQRSKWLRDVFGLRAIAGGSKFVSIGDDFKYIMDAIADSEGAAERTAKQMDEGIGGAIRITISAFQELANVIGEAISPELIQFGKYLQGLANEWITYLKYHRNVVVEWTSFAAKIAKWGALLFGLGSVVRTIGSVFGGFVSAGKNMMVYFKAFSKASGDVDVEMKKVGSDTRKAGYDFGLASGEFKAAAKNMTDAAVLAVKAGDHIKNANTNIAKGGVGAEKAAARAERAGAMFDTAAKHARTAATAFASVNKQIIDIGAVFTTAGTPMVAALKAFHGMVSFFAKSGEAVVSATKQIDALAGTLVRFAKSTQDAAYVFAQAAPVFSIYSRDLKTAGVAASKVLKAMGGFAAQAGEGVKTLGGAMETTAGAETTFASNTAAVVSELEQVAASATKAGAAVKSVGTSIKGVQQYAFAAGPGFASQYKKGATTPKFLNVPGMVKQYESLKAQKQAYLTQLRSITSFTNFLKQGGVLPPSWEKMFEADADKLRRQIFSITGQTALVRKRFPLMLPTQVKGAIDKDTRNEINRQAILRNQRVRLPDPLKYGNGPVPSTLGQGSGLDVPKALGMPVYATRYEANTDQSRPTVMTPVPKSPVTYAIQGEKPPVIREQYSQVFKPNVQLAKGFTQTANAAVMASKNITLAGDSANKTGVSISHLYSALKPVAPQVSRIEQSLIQASKPIASIGASVRDFGKTIGGAVPVSQNLGKQIYVAGSSAEKAAKAFGLSKSAIKSAQTSMVVAGTSATTAATKFNDWNLATTKANVTLNQTEEYIKKLPPVITTTSQVAASAGKSFSLFGQAAKTAGLAVLGFAKALGGMLLFSAAFQGIWWAIGKLKEGSKTVTDMQEKLDKLNSSFSEDRNQMKRLVEINSAHNKTNEMLDEAATIVGELQSKYGDLGLSVDRVTKSVEGLKDATQAVNDLTERQTVMEYDAISLAIPEIEKNIGKLEELHGDFRSKVVPQSYDTVSRETLEYNSYDITEAVGKYGWNLGENPYWRKLLDPYLHFSEHDLANPKTPEERNLAKLYNLNRPVITMNKNGGWDIFPTEWTKELQGEISKNNAAMIELTQNREKLTEYRSQQQVLGEFGVKDISEETIGSLASDYPFKLGISKEALLPTDELITAIDTKDYKKLLQGGADALRYNLANTSGSLEEERDALIEMNKHLAAKTNSGALAESLLAPDSKFGDLGLFARLGRFGGVGAGRDMIGGNLDMFNEQADEIQALLAKRSNSGSAEDQAMNLANQIAFEEFRKAYVESANAGTLDSFNWSQFDDVASYVSNIIMREILDNLRRQQKNLKTQIFQNSEEVKQPDNTTLYRIVTKRDEEGNPTDYRNNGELYGEPMMKAILTKLYNEESQPLLEAGKFFVDIGNLGTNIAKIQELTNNIEKLNNARNNLPEIIQNSESAKFLDERDAFYNSAGLGDALKTKYKEIDRTAEELRKAAEVLAEDLRKAGEKEYEGLPLDKWLTAQYDGINRTTDELRKQASIELAGDNTARRGVEKTHEYLIDILRKMDRDYILQKGRIYGQYGYQNPIEQRKVQIEDQFNELEKQMSEQVQEAKEKGTDLYGMNPDEWFKQFKALNDLVKQAAYRQMYAYYGVLDPGTSVGPFTPSASVRPFKSDAVASPKTPGKNKENERSFRMEGDEPIGDYVTGHSDSGIPYAKWEPAVNQSETPNEHNKARLKRIENLRRATGYQMSIEEADEFLHNRDQALDAADRKARAEQAVDRMLDERTQVFDNIRADGEKKKQENREALEFQKELWGTQRAEHKRQEAQKKADNAKYWQESQERADSVQLHPYSEQDELYRRRVESLAKTREMHGDKEAQERRKWLVKDDPEFGKWLKQRQKSLDDTGASFGYGLVKDDPFFKELKTINDEMDAVDWDFPNDYKRLKKKQKRQVTTPSEQIDSPESEHNSSELAGPEHMPSDYDAAQARMDEFRIPEGLPEGLSVPAQEDGADKFFNELRDSASPDDKKTLNEIGNLEKQYKEFQKEYSQEAADEYLDYLQTQTDSNLPEGQRIGTQSGQNRRIWAKNAEKKASEIKRQQEEAGEAFAYDYNRTMYDLMNQSIDHDIDAARTRQGIAQQMGNEQGAAEEEAYIKQLEQQKAANKYYKELDNIERLEKNRNDDLEQYQKDQKEVDKQEKKINKMKKKNLDVTEEEAKLAEMEQKRDASRDKYLASNEQFGNSANYIAAMNAYGTPQAQQMLWDINRSFSSKGTFDAYETGGQDVSTWTAEFKEQTTILGNQATILGNIEDYLATMASGEYL